MATKVLYGELLSDKSHNEVMKAIINSFQIVGGNIQETKTGIIITDGKNQVKKAFMANKLTVMVDCNQISEGKYNLVCSINWQPYYFLHFLMFLWGFVTVVTWIYNILYFFIDPIPIYQNALDRVKFYLD